MKWVIPALAGVLVWGQSYAQVPYLKRVFVLNEGHYNYWTSTIEVPVTVGYVDMDTRQYVVFDTIWGARFGVDMLLEDSFLYVTADTFLIKYNIHTLERVAEAHAIGLRKMAISGLRLYVTRGELPSLGCCNSYLQVYDKNTLTLVAEADTTSTLLKWHSDGILVLGDSVYVAANNAFVWGNTVGYIVKFPVSNITAMDTINLGPDGLNPENILTDGINIYTVNNTDFTTTSVSTYARMAGTVNTVDLGMPSGCTGSELAHAYIYFQPYYADASWSQRSTQLLRTPTTSIGVLDTLPLGKAFYAIKYDSLNDYLWITETDFVHWGLLLAYTAQDHRFVDAFAVGVTPGALAFEYALRDTTTSTPTAVPSALTSTFRVITLPDQQVLFLGQVPEGGHVTVYDVTGQQVWHKALPAGAFYEIVRLPAVGSYLVILSTASEQNLQRIWVH